MPRIAIVGGGISGVAAAYELSKHGHTDFVLYEASARLGGTVETHRQDGFIIECGPDSWVTEKPSARELAIELGLENEIIPSNDASRRTYLVIEGKLTPMPDGMRMMVPGDIEAIENSPLFSESAKRAYRDEPTRAAELRATAAARSADEDESVASFVERHFGQEVAEKIAGPLLAGVFGGDTRQLSVKAVMAPFVRLEREYGSLVLGLSKQSRAGSASSVFTSLKSGLQALIDGMVKALPSSAVCLQEPVSNVKRKEKQWHVTTAAGDSIFDHVLLATPVHISRGLVASCDEQLASLLEIDSTSAIVAAFAFDRKASTPLSIPEGFGFLAPQTYATANPEGEPQLLAATFVHQKFSYRAPEGCVLLRAFYGGSSAPALLEKGDDVLIDLAHRHLGRILGELPKPQIALVRRWPYSLPQYRVGHLARVARIESLLERTPGLHLIGNAFHGVGLPDLVRLGRSVARTILSA